MKKLTGPAKSHVKGLAACGLAIVGLLSILVVQQPWAAGGGTPPATVASKAGPHVKRGDATGSRVASTDATAACAEAAQRWQASGVSAAYESTAGAVQTWRETRQPGQTPQWPALSPSEAAVPTAVCYLTGDFSGIPSAPGAGSAYSDIIVLVNETTGDENLDVAGPTANWPFSPPSS